MKRKHTEAKKANRRQSHYEKYRKISKFGMDALFGRKEFSKTSKRRAKEMNPKTT